MSNPRLIGLAARLCCLGVATVFLAGAGCKSGGSGGSGGSGAPSAQPSTEKPGDLSRAAALARGSGGGAGGPGLPVQFSGNGGAYSVPFLINTGTVTVYYAYNCSSAGGSGNFAADMISGSPSTRTTTRASPTERRGRIRRVDQHYRESADSRQLLPCGQLRVQLEHMAEKG